jgi:excisionase family DNA binding protein
MITIQLPKHDLLTPGEVADLLRVSRSTVYTWHAMGTLAGVKLGKVLRFSRNEVLNFIRRGRNKDFETQSMQYIELRVSFTPSL